MSKPKHDMDKLKTQYAIERDQLLGRVRERGEVNLHPPILFLGDKPNPKKNLSMDVAFVGSPSYKTLLEWIYRMDLDINLVKLMNSHIRSGLSAWHWQVIDSDTIIIALGKEAAEAVQEFNTNRIKPVRTFALPHPSGLNRELNDKKKLSDLLTKCRNFVYGR